MKHSWGVRLTVGAGLLLAAAGPVLPVLAADGNGPGVVDNNIAGALIGAGFVVGSDGTATANSTVNIQIDPVTLSLDAVPDLKFENVSIADLVKKDVDAKLTLGTDITDKGTFDGNDTGQIAVSDYRGTNTGWNLSASLGTFADLTVTNLSLEGAVDTANIVAGEFADKPLTPGSGATSVINAPIEKGAGDTILQLSGGTLALPKDPSAKKGLHQATITWTLSQEPETTTP
ncbi:WxL domain-containing protein [Lacticaseibacillus mingshuiensis]|uniref:WxL domain-containing protein n=1 Tax=Lacticaseibacillus mingshuiensis TaxID=2799574 RepID=UPI0019509AA6|nr:WxL domain-containing protein [Lacticaseibacillus mingshuiensis]